MITLRSGAYSVSALKRGRVSRWPRLSSAIRRQAGWQIGVSPGGVFIGQTRDPQGADRQAGRLGFSDRSAAPDVWTQTVRHRCQGRRPTLPFRKNDVRKMTDSNATISRNRCSVKFAALLAVPFPAESSPRDEGTAGFSGLVISNKAAQNPGCGRSTMSCGVV